MSIDAKVIKFKYRDFVYLIVGSKIIARENKSRPQISLKKKKSVVKLHHAQLACVALAGHVPD